MKIKECCKALKELEGKVVKQTGKKTYIIFMSGMGKNTWIFNFTYCPFCGKKIEVEE